MKKILNKSKVYFFLVFFFSAYVIFVPIVIACTTSAECPGYGIAWCETWGQCDETTCVGIDGLGVMCMCDEASDIFYCPPPV
jgi:hypothetical protein